MKKIFLSILIFSFLGFLAPTLVFAQTYCNEDTLLQIKIHPTNDPSKSSKDLIIPVSQVSQFSLYFYQAGDCEGYPYLTSYYKNEKVEKKRVNWYYNPENQLFESREKFPTYLQSGQWKWTISQENARGDTLVSDTAKALITDDQPSNTNGPPPNNTNTGGPPQPNANTRVQVNSTINYDLGPALENPLNAKSVPELITRIIKILLLLIAMAAVIMIIIGGFRMVIGGGNPAELAKAKSTIIWAIIGLVIALMSFSIVAIVQKLIQT